MIVWNKSYFISYYNECFGNITSLIWCVIILFSLSVCSIFFFREIHFIYKLRWSTNLFLACFIKRNITGRINMVLENNKSLVNIINHAAFENIIAYSFQLGTNFLYFHWNMRYFQINIRRDSTFTKYIVIFQIKSVGFQEKTFILNLSIQNKHGAVNKYNTIY